jgi:two-component system cell cycle response regulator DivK
LLLFSRFIRWHGAGNSERMVAAPEAVTHQIENTSALVLLVDDSRDAREMYGEYLRFAGFRVVTAENGIEALAAAQAEWPAVILMDLAMPRMDGWEAIRRLRADPLTADIPIVALSAYAFGDEPNRARLAGADLCLSKPCLPPQVARVVRAMLVSSRGSSH